jgi:hypothetical protein
MAKDNGKAQAMAAATPATISTAKMVPSRAPKGRLTASITLGGEPIAVVSAPGRVFKSGKIGYWGNFDWTDDEGNRWTGQVQLVKAHSETD